MSSDAPDAATSPGRSRLRASLAALIILALAAVLAVTAFYSVCAGFVLYDDVGYMMLTQKTFLAGHPLYDQTFTRYGPAYYAWERLLHLLTGLPLTHDATLLFTTAALVTIPLLCAGFVARMTRNIFLTALAAFAVFWVVVVLKKEAGHPQELCGLLLGGMLLASTFLPQARRPGLILGLIGFFVGVLGMTKPNLGLFAAVAGWLTLANLLSGRIGRNLLFGAGALVALALPLVLMRHNLAGVKDYCLLVTGAVLLLIIQLASSRSERSLPWMTLLAPAVGCFVGVLLCAGYALAKGTSPAGLIQGLVLQHLSFEQAFFRWPAFGMEAVVPSLGLALGAWFVTGPGRDLWQKAPWVPALVKVATAPFLLLVALLAGPFINPAFVWCLPLLAATAAQPPSSSWEAAPRQFAVSLAIFMSLWGYPIWGLSQAALSFFLLLPVALVWCSDGLRYGQWQFGIKARPRSERSKTAITLFSFVAALGIVVVAVVRADSTAKLYHRLPPSGLRGSNLLRMPQEQSDFYQHLIQAARVHGRSFFTMPGLGSLYFWADAEPPTCIYPTTWMTLLSPEQQAKVVQDLEQAPDLCVIRWNRLVKFWLRNRDVSDNKIVRYIEDNFLAAESFDGCDVLVRRPATPNAGAKPGTR
jgi:hypothetical protein